MICETNYGTMKKLLFALFILIPVISAYSQSANLKETFLEAESYFLFEEYNEALPLYLKINRENPDNDNINYKIGVCFLNDPYQKDKSIRYLEKASQNINPDYKENNFKERTAPPEAFFYLGNAYLVNNDIEKALKNYKHFRDILDEKIYDTELVENQITICETASKLMNIPVDFDAETLSENINSQFTDMNPIMSGDGKRLVWVSKRRFYDATMFSEKVDGEWQPPRMILPELGVDRDVYPTCLNYDGTIMIIYRSDDFIGNLYQSELVDGQWTNMHKLGDNINTKYWESHACMTKDENTLYFTSNRKGGFGGLDIYKSEKQEDGSWGEPVNLGETINTRYNEETPFITENGELLYFSSYGHFNMGGYDIFYSRKNEYGQWDIPVNMGYPINSTDDDLFFFPVNNGNNAFFSMYNEGEGQGLHDLYYLDVYSDDNPRMYTVTGYLSAEDDKLTESDNVRVYLLKQLTGDTIDNTLPDFELRKFTLQAPQGKYNLVVKSDPYKDVVTPLEITKESDKEGIQLENELALETKPYIPKLFTGEESKIEAEETTFNVTSGEPVKIRLKLEKDALLIADVYVNSIPAESDTFMINKKRFTYEMVPQAGLNTIELTLVEENGDQSKKTILVYADEPEVVEPGEIITEEIASEEIVSEEIAALNIQDSIDRRIQQINNRLSEYADGNLKSTLDTLNISKLGLNSTKELIDYLQAAAEENGYTEEDIDKAIANAVSGGDLEILHDLMLQNAEGPLKEYLEKLDLEAEGLTTPEQYMKHLREAVETGGFTNDDIDMALARAMDQVNNDAELLRLEMLKNADSPFKELLETLDLKALNIQSREDLIQYLLEHSDELGMNKEELTRTLIELLGEFYLEEHVPGFEKESTGSSDGLAIGGGLLAIGIGAIIFFIFWKRKRKKKEQEDRT